ncbi:MAG: asparagine synthase (glutamine-hydrolyzing) [Eubacterium sp.]|nr:asparagine synthase (glutamine-hydrolyzing) [Eubacterium sp.]
MCAILTYARTDVAEAFFAEMLRKTQSRGPDMTDHIKTKGGWIGFNRLSIMGPSPTGMQPFTHRGNAIVCNGEVYGFGPLKEYLASLGYPFESGSDCELLMPLYEKLGTAMFNILDAEFACVIYDGEKNEIIAARDPIGIRPLYYGYDEDGYIAFASEPKNIQGVVKEIKPFPPGHFYRNGEFTCYRDMTTGGVYAKEGWNPGKAGHGRHLSGVGNAQSRKTSGSMTLSNGVGIEPDGLDAICEGIHDRLMKGIEKRLTADQPIGFLLSGGLDSSLVCGAAAKLWDGPIETFAIGMDIDAIDLKYARQVADYIHSNHHEVIISKDDVLEAVEPVIAALATYDITTIRASIGMYLLCKWIRENTDIRVLLTGEISDELFGYKYTDFAPDATAFQEESKKRIRELHMYDVLRADRCISVNSLEARVPFGDLDFVDYVMAIDPAKKMNTYGIGKYLLRHAFEEDELIPREILMREKAAFSDAVGHSLRDDLIELAESTYTDDQYESGITKYTHARPFTKESLLYRDIFEKYYPGQSQMVDDFWMPNKSWEGCNVNDPSARVLSNYGASGE